MDGSIVGELRHGEVIFPLLDVLLDEYSEERGDGSVDHLRLSICLRVVRRGEEELDAELGV